MKDGKVCRKCGEFKLYSKYGRVKLNKDGHRRECKICVAEYNREYYQQNAEYLREYQREYHQQNPEYSREYYQQNAEQKREYNLEYHQQNATKLASHHREYKQQNAERYRAYSERRRARQLNAEGDHTGEDRIFLHGSGFCVYCNCACEDGHIDHIYPLSTGGSNNVANLVYSCAPCNLSKSAKPPLQWIVEQGLDIDDVSDRYREQHLLEMDEPTPFD